MNRKDCIDWKGLETYLSAEVGVCGEAVQERLQLLPPPERGLTCFWLKVRDIWAAARWGRW